MKFEKLVQLMEVKGVSGGNAIHNAMNAEKPKGFAKSSAVFGSDNNELREKQSRWEWDTSQPLDTKGQMMQTKVWKNMLVAFGILFNDPHFDVKVQELAKDFDSKRDSIPAEEEKDYILSLRRIDDYASKMTNMETAINNLQRMLNYNSADRPRKDEEVIKNGRLKSDIQSRESFIKRDDNTEDFLKLTKELEGLKNQLTNVLAKIPNSKNPEQYDEQVARLQKDIRALDTKLSTNRAYKKLYLHYEQLKKLKRRLSTSDDILSYMNCGDSEISAIKSEIFDDQKKLEELTTKYDKAVAKRDELAPHIDIVNEENEKLSEWASRNFIGHVKASADSIYNKLSTESKGVVDDLTLSNFEVEPEKMDNLMANLKALASDDASVNPIVGYIDKFRDSYNNRDYDPNLQLNPNINITAVRDYGRLPFVIMMKIYASLRTNRKIISLDNLNTVRNEEAVAELKTALEGMTRWTRSNSEKWENPQTKLYFSQLIDLFPKSVSQSKKNELKSKLNGRFTTINGKTSSAIMLEEIERALRKKYNESFDKTLSRYMKNISFDEDEFNMDLLEVVGRCFGK